MNSSVTSVSFLNFKSIVLALPQKTMCARGDVETFVHTHKVTEEFLLKLVLNLKLPLELGN